MPVDCWIPYLTCLSIIAYQVRTPRMWILTTVYAQTYLKDTYHSTIPDRDYISLTLDYPSSWKRRIHDPEHNISTWWRQSYLDCQRMMSAVHPMTIIPERKCRTSVQPDIFIMKYVTTKMLIHLNEIAEIHYDSIPFAGQSDLQVLTLISRGVLPPQLEVRSLST